MSRYDGLIIPRSYSEYINKTDAATLQQALQLSGVLSGSVAAGDNKAVTSNAVNNALTNYIKHTTVTYTAQEIGTRTDWIGKVISLPINYNKIISAQIIGYVNAISIVTYWGFEVRILSVDGSNALIGLKKTVSDDWQQNIDILITYY